MSALGDTFVRVERSEAVAIVSINRGVTNPINLAVVEQLGSAIRAAGEDRSVLGLVLTSASSKFFSIGFDLPAFLGAFEDEFRRFFSAFTDLCTELYALPKPTVAALAGHAVAGGCILALACDYRHIAAGRKLMGLNEVKLGVPVPYAADCMLRALVGHRTARDIMEAGEFCAPDESARLGLVDAVVPGEKVVASSVARAARLGGMPGTAYARIKANRVAGTLREIRADVEAKDREFVEAWYTPEVRAKLREAAARF